MNRWHAEKVIAENGGLLSDDGRYILLETIKEFGTDAFRDCFVVQLAEKHRELRMLQNDLAERYNMRTGS